MIENTVSDKSFFFINCCLDRPTENKEHELHYEENGAPINNDAISSRYRHKKHEVDTSICIDWIKHCDNKRAPAVKECTT